MGTLQFSFHGPFLYRFSRGQVEIYAPKCRDHAAGLFTAKNELPLTGRHRRGNSRCYRVDGPIFTPPANTLSPLFHDPDNTILAVSATARPSFHQAHFCIVMPVPQVVIPLLPNDVEVVDNSTNPPGTPTGALVRRATGLRFYYEADLSKVLNVSLDGSPASPWVSDFDAPDLGHPFADAEIRYAALHAEPLEHQDAYECFDQIASLAGLDWWLSFDNLAQLPGPQPFIKTGGDCHAPILAIR